MKLITTLCLLACCASRAGLEWKEKEVAMEVLPTQVFTEAVFRFTNAGPQPITIGDVRVGCGCLAPRLAKRTYAVGEDGELVIRFDLRNRTGQQKKQVVVKTSDGAETKLTTLADIPKAYDIAPIMMKWVDGNTAESKTAKLVNPNKIPIKLVSANSSHKDLPVVLKTIREGFEYEVVVTRAPTARNARAVVRIETEKLDGQESKTLKFYVHAQ
ncbi:hypothetical protein PDESU_05949 [Pontiella desulfatans]|uniref:DUF1573 domain-containing protein n=1 Tax=Pontiella desulfatans TaxID=2750659 RepID=A0A6C2UBV1_PONDE|nr:DUF1573 domain-containing protein [Pontiella desulfatans]VGO17353.1 hypothetical protein PDESU_05949 [Pontiella desulfatans]